MNKEAFRSNESYVLVVLVIHMGYMHSNTSVSFVDNLFCVIAEEEETFTTDRLAGRQGRQGRHIDMQTDR